MEEGGRWGERGGTKEGSVKGEEGDKRGRTEAHGVEEGGMWRVERSWMCGR